MLGATEVLWREGSAGGHVSVDEVARPVDLFDDLNSCRFLRPLASDVGGVRMDKRLIPLVQRHLFDVVKSLPFRQIAEPDLRLGADVDRSAAILGKVYRVISLHPDDVVVELLEEF